jgi:hypothetical protein
MVAPSSVPLPSFITCLPAMNTRISYLYQDWHKTHLVTCSVIIFTKNTQRGMIIIFFFRGLRCCFDTIMSTVRYVTVRYFAIWHPSSDTVCPDDGILQFFQITAFLCGPRPRYICLPLLNYMFSEVFSIDQPCENRVISYGGCLCFRRLGFDHRYIHSS